MAERKSTREVRIGDVVIGGNHPIAIQSMTNTKTQDVEATVAQILQLERAGCQIIRSTVPDMEAAKALQEIKKQIHIPLVADIHFDYRLAILGITHGRSGTSPIVCHFINFHQLSESLHQPAQFHHLCIRHFSQGKNIKA